MMEDAIKFLEDYKTKLEITAEKLELEGKAMASMLEWTNIVSIEYAISILKIERFGV